MRITGWRKKVVAARPAATPPAPPYWSPKGALIAFFAALFLCWPMIALNGPLIYADTAGYYSLGQKIMALAETRLGLGSAADGATPAVAGGGSNTEGIKLRSIPYSVYTYVTASTPLGLWLTCLLQAALVLFATAVLIPPMTNRAARRFAIALAGIALVSSLPWFVSYAMPDLLAALVVVFYLAMLRQVDGLSAAGRLILAALAGVAILAHYGNIPLAAGLAVAVIGWRWFEKSLTGWAIALCLAPVLFAAAFNVASGKASTGEESIAPKRLPILLARSIEDGPARWYLAEACQTDTYTICELSDTIPDNVGAFLWGDFYRSATDAQVEAIRAEETEILFEAFKRYPLAQSRALLGNAIRQTVSVGTGELWPPVDGLAAPTAERATAGGEKALDHNTLLFFDAVVPVATFLGIAALAIAAFRRGIAYEHAVMAGYVILALALNAAIFGGLSAPVDRYQSRIVWLLPFVLLLALCAKPEADVEADLRAK